MVLVERATGKEVTVTYEYVKRALTRPVFAATVTAVAKRQACSILQGRRNESGIILPYLHNTHNAIGTPPPPIPHH